MVTLTDADKLERGGETTSCEGSGVMASQQTKNKKRHIILIGFVMCCVAVALGVVLFQYGGSSTGKSNGVSSGNDGNVGDNSGGTDEDAGKDDLENAITDDVKKDNNSGNTNQDKIEGSGNDVDQGSLTDTGNQSGGEAGSGSGDGDGSGGGDGDIKDPSEATAFARSFSITLPEFSSDILEGYETCDDMVSDVEQAFMYVTNLAIKDALLYWDGYRYDYNVDMVEAPMMEESMMVDSTVSATKSEATGTTSAAGQDDYGTNNQVDGVDEADIVKSDGKHVYAAYGDVLVVLDLTGNVLSRTKMPDPNRANVTSSEEEEKEEDQGGSTSSSTSASSNSKPIQADMMYMPSATMESNQRISSLLLDSVSNRVTAIVTSIPQYWWHGSNIENDGDNGKIPDMLGTDTTHIYIYSTTSLATTLATSRQQGDEEPLTLYSQNALIGSFKAGRSIGSKAYIVSHNNINSWVFRQELERWNERYKDMDKDEYANAAMDFAIENINTYAKSLVQEIMGVGSDGGCKTFVKISLMQPIGGDGLDLSMNYNGILNGIAQVVSFDMNHDEATIDELFIDEKGEVVMSTPISRSGAFLPTSYINTYASADMLVLAGQGWHESIDNDGYEEYTYLIGFGLSSSTSTIPATPLATGIVNGYLLNQFALDWYEDHLRVATTTSAKWGRITSTGADGASSTTYAVTAMSESQVMVLALEGTQFKEVGRVEELGVDERIYAVRFMGDRGFVVTFRQTDPLYTLDLSLPQNPIMVGELKVDGFSNYLHPMKDQNYLLAIGQDADPETGRALGLAISVFDVRDMSNPTRVQYHVIRESYSDAQNDHLAFRFLSDAVLDTRGILMVPVSIYGGDYFDGFYFYNVDAITEGGDGIDVRGKVTHADSSNYYGCYGSAYLQSRNMVFQGKVMTFKGHSVMSHDLDDLKAGPRWTTSLDDEDELETSNMCHYWFR